MKRKRWLVTASLLFIVFIIILIGTPNVLNIIFEKTTRLLEQQLLETSPPEYEGRIKTAFDQFIFAFKENRIKKSDLGELSGLIKSANEDKNLTKDEIDQILEFIEEVVKSVE